MESLRGSHARLIHVKFDKLELPWRWDAIRVKFFRRIPASTLAPFDQANGDRIRHLNAVDGLTCFYGGQPYAHPQKLGMSICLRYSYNLLLWLFDVQRKQQIWSTTSKLTRRFCGDIQIAWMTEVSVLKQMRGYRNPILWYLPPTYANVA